jgi:aspartate ammonia-lyase
MRGFQGRAGRWGLLVVFLSINSLLLLVTGDSRVGTAGTRETKTSLKASEPQNRVKMRKEHDSLGELELPNDVYYGVQTQRAMDNFPVSALTLKNFPNLINALAYIKKAAALANHDLGVLSQKKMKVIVEACDEILTGKLHDQFVVGMIQGGAGTSTNMNANEVIANRALQSMGHQKGEYQYLHPNDNVNRSQSTNGVYPTAIKLAVLISLKDTLPVMDELQVALEAKAAEFKDVIKMGRTHLQDAVPMTMGQEFAAYAVIVGEAKDNLKLAGNALLKINLGGTAIGTGINSPPGFAARATKHLAEITGFSFQPAPNLVAATQDSGAFVQISGALKRAAVQISTICSDLRLLTSGPRAGLFEIRLPAVQPGSTIMPGKVNPVIPELVNQICYQIVGFDVTVTLAAEGMQLENNVNGPIIAFDLLEGLRILKKACSLLTNRCIVGITANRDRCREYVKNSIGVVTALSPVIGYEKAAAIAEEALTTNRGVYDLVLEKGWISKDVLEDLLRPEKMIHPRQLPKIGK